MSNSLRFDGSTGFRFTRPTIGRIGTANDLHPNVKAAVDVLVTRLEEGFPAPTADARRWLEELEAAALEKDRAAKDAQSQADDHARAVHEAYEEHAKAEDIAERKAEEYEEALLHVGGKIEGEPQAELNKLEEARDAARETAERAVEALEAIKLRAQESNEFAATAKVEANNAWENVQNERDKLRKVEDDFTQVLALPIYSRDTKVKTLLSTPKPKANAVDLSYVIDGLGDTEELYEVRRLINQNAKRLPFNLIALLARDEVVEYMFARAKYVKGFTEAEGIFNSIVDEDRGGAFLYNFVTDYALERMRIDERLNISPVTLDKMAQRLQRDSVLLRRDSFEAALKSLSTEFVYGDKELELILAAERQLNIDIPASFQPALVDYIRRTNANGEQINDNNAAYFISIALAKLQKEDISLRPTAQGAQVGVEDYSVSYYEDRITAPEYERASVEAAAQMYLTMVWGDMLGIFQSVDRIAMQAPIKGQGPILLEVRSRELSDDLRMYVLDEEYRDLKTGRVSRRISPTERQMFYRQLFGIGDAQVVAEEQVNPDFQRYWAVLMMEVVKYIDKVEENGDNYRSISPSKVYQAMEDLQYNLSAYCTGLPKIAAPSMYAEMDFVIQRILDSDDVKQQLGRRGSPSFWKVVEQVRGMQDFTPLRNKGIFGHKIISTIARATPDFVEDQSAFEEFIANVEAFIVAEDQLAEAGSSMAGLQFPGFFGMDAASAGRAFPGMPGSFPGMPSGLPGMPGGMFGAPAGGGSGAKIPGSNGSGQSADDWNF
jgi:hypothetical protein